MFSVRVSPPKPADRLVAARRHLERETRALVKQLRAWPRTRWLAPAGPLPTRADATFHLATVFAVLAEQLEPEGPREPRVLPRLESDLALPDQLAVTAADLVTRLAAQGLQRPEGLERPEVASRPARFDGPEAPERRDPQEREPTAVAGRALAEVLLHRHDLGEARVPAGAAGAALNALGLGGGDDRADALAFSRAPGRAGDRLGTGPALDPAGRLIAAARAGCPAYRGNDRGFAAEG